MYYRTWKQEAIGNVSTKKKQVSLTFDDGPNANALFILDMLDKNNIKGTFFWIVSHALKLQKEDPKTFALILKRIKEGGHTIGFHAPRNYFPTPFTLLFGKFSREEFNSGLTKLESLTGVKTKFYRPHRFQYGASIIYARENGLKTIIGIFPNMLWPAAVQAKKFSKAQPGDILIFHERDNIKKILSHVIQDLTKKGFTYSTLSQLQ